MSEFGKRVLLQSVDQKSLPDNAIRITDRSEAPEGAQIVEGERGGLAYVPEDSEKDSEDAPTDTADRANADGTIDVGNLEEGDIVEDTDGTFGEMRIQGVGTDETGTVVQFEDADGEEYFIYDDMIGDMVVPGAETTDDTQPDEEPTEDTTTDDSGIEEGDRVEFDGIEGTVEGYDPDTDTALVITDDGEEWFQTGDALRDDPEPEPDPINERLTDETNIPDNVSVNVAELGDERATEVIEGLNAVDEAIGLGQGDVFSVTTEPPDDVGPSADAAFHTGNRTLYVNPDAATGDEREELFEQGYVATPNQQGNIMHEMIHSKHSRAAIRGDAPPLDELRSDNFSDEQKATIRDEVSEYASINGMEFVGEVGSGIMSGQEYSDEIMEMYDDLGGPEVDV